MNILPRFSFQYNGKSFHPEEARVRPADYGRCYELADGLCIELHIQKYSLYITLFHILLQVYFCVNKHNHYSAFLCLRTASCTLLGTSS